MADEPEQDQESSPSLEPPRLFGRRKRKPKREPAAAEPAATTTEPEPTPEPEPAPQPEPAPEPEPAPGPEPAPEPAAVEEAPTEPVPLVEPFETPRSSAPQEPPEVDEEPTAVYDATDPTADVAPVPEEAEAQEEPAPPRRATRVPLADREPVASPRVGAVLTGVVAGALLIGLVLLGFQACEAARGSNSCGTVPGMALLLLVFALTVVASGVLLRYFRVPDPGVTGFVAVALVGVVALFMVDQLDTWPMLVVIPLVSAAAFLASWWITTTYVEPQS